MFTTLYICIIKVTAYFAKKYYTENLDGFYARKTSYLLK